MTLYPLPERNLDYINTIIALGFPFNPHVGLRDVMRSMNNYLNTNKCYGFSSTKLYTQVRLRIITKLKKTR